MVSMFSNCSSLISLPDISKWNTNNVTNMVSMFSNCSSLISLPDISKWNTNNVTDKEKMFSDCSSLISLPDISKWNINNPIDETHLFNDIFLLLSKKEMFNINTYDKNYSNSIIDKDNSNKLSSKFDESIKEEYTNDYFEINKEKYEDNLTDDEDDYDSLLSS